MDSSSPGIRYPAVVDRVYTEALVSEIVSGKLKIEDSTIADAPYDHRCEVLQTDLAGRSTKGHFTSKAAINEFKRDQLQSSKKKKKRAAPTKEPGIAERGTQLDSVAKLEEGIEERLLELKKNVNESKTTAPPFPEQQVEDREENQDEETVKMRDLRKSNMMLSNMITRILYNAPKRTFTVSDVKKYEGLADVGTSK